MVPIINPQSKKEAVYCALRDEIVSGEMSMGSRLVIDEISGRYGVSQTPIREALRQLEAEGMVEFQAHVGARVTELNADRISEIMGLMEALEIVAGHHACRQTEKKAFDEIEAFVEKMDGFVDDPACWSKMNSDLHKMICERAGTPLVAIMMEKVRDHWLRLYNAYLTDVKPGRIAQAQKDHWHILRAMRSGDIDKTEKLIKNHNRSALAAYEKALKERTKA